MTRPTRREILRCALATVGVSVFGDGFGNAAEPEYHPLEWRSITDVAGIKVGHFTDTRRPTGCTVILTEENAVDIVK